MAESVKQKAAKGVVWSTIQRFSAMGIQFVSGIVLARLLTPSDYGAIGMLLIFMLVSQTIMDSGFSAALIQRKNPTQLDYSTVFWWEITLAVVMYLVLFGTAPFIAKFYRMPILCMVLRVQAISLILGALSSIQRTQLRKQFRFKEICIVSVSTSLVSLGVTIVLAYKGFGVWSLVAQHVLMSFIPMVAFAFAAKWLPSFSFSKEAFKGLFSFGFFIFLTHVINEICNNIQGLLIGRFYNASTMGYYSKARSTETLAATSISHGLTQVTFPLYSAIQDDKVALSDMIKKLTVTVAYLMFPMMLLLVLVAKPIFLVLYSDRWLPSVPYFQILCLSGMAVCLQAINLQAISAIGKSKTMFSWTVIKRCVGMTLLIGGLWLWQIQGLLVGMVCSSWFIYIVNAYLVSKHIGYKLQRQLLDLLPIFLLSVIAFVASWTFSQIYTMDVFLSAALKTTFFLGVYLLLSYFCHLKGLSWSVEIVKKILKKEKK